MSNFRLLYNSDKLIPVTERKGNPYLTKYERAKVLGVRASQLGKNAPCMVDPKGEYNVLEIAKMELEQGVLPLILQRHLPNGTVEEWTIAELHSFKN